MWVAPRRSAGCGLEADGLSNPDLSGARYRCRAPTLLASVRYGSDPETLGKTGAPLGLNRGVLATANDARLLGCLAPKRPSKRSIAQRSAIGKRARFYGEGPGPCRVALHSRMGFNSMRAFARAPRPGGKSCRGAQGLAGQADTERRLTGIQSQGGSKRWRQAGSAPGSRKASVLEMF